MKNGLLSFLAVSVCLVLPAGVDAQSKTGPKARRVADKDAVAVVEAPTIDVKATFSLSTTSERWTLNDPLPTGNVDFGGKRLTFDDRMVGSSVTTDGEQQLLFPVSWFEPYGSINPDIKYVVVKYRDGKAATIMAEYVPDRVSMPKESFKAYPDGKTFYSDVAVYRQDGQVYLKQVTSKGTDDGKGGYYIDVLMIYRVQDTMPAPAAKVTPGRKTP